MRLIGINYIYFFKLVFMSWNFHVSYESQHLGGRKTINRLKEEATP